MCVCSKTPVTSPCSPITVYGRLGFWLKCCLKAATVVKGWPHSNDAEVSLFQVPYHYVVPALQGHLSGAAHSSPEGFALAHTGIVRLGAQFEVRAGSRDAVVGRRA